MAYDLDRFVTAQDSVMPAVMAELRDGRKRSHWMWFIFPQLRGLGSSPTAVHYALASRAEAQAYLAHPVLGPRLVDCTDRVNQVQGRDVHAIFGSPDDLKFHSCITLFDALGTGETVFHDAMARYFAGSPDRRTLDLLTGMA